MVSEERIVFCIKLWLKELRAIPQPDESTMWVITQLENEILNGEYCSDEEFANRRSESGAI